MSRKIRVVELFAGVGGFRLGLEGYKGKSASSGYTRNFETPYEVIWSNQYEPATKKVQHASQIYVERFGKENHENSDISKFPIQDIPDHDVLVGGFPCQDFSVAKGFKAAGLDGSKGELWWSIHAILAKHDNPPKYLILENVDRLRNNPHSDRGRDFAIVLDSLARLGYFVEWRVIDSAEYGMPQRRKRIYLVGFHKDTKMGNKLLDTNNPGDWIQTSGVLATAFPCKIGALSNYELKGDRKALEENFQLNGLGIDRQETTSPRHRKLGKSISPFLNAGVIVERRFYTSKASSRWSGTGLTLGDVIERNGCVPDQYFISQDSLAKWERLKGKKNITRTHKPTGIEYSYTEGAVTFPDLLSRPSRTVVTGEGGGGASRFKHVIVHPGTEKYRRLTPVELERLNMFPDNFTEGLSDTRRAFLMGNSVVVGVIEKIGTELAIRILED